MRKYSYAIMLLKETDKEVNERNIENLLESVNITYNEQDVKAIIASLEGVDIEEELDQLAEEKEEDEQGGLVSNLTDKF